MEKTAEDTNSSGKVDTAKGLDGNASGSTASVTTGSSTVKNNNLCGVCNAQAAKYKCPRCRLPYCSVPCNKTHRENHPPDPKPEAVAEAPVTAGMDPKKPPSHPFIALDSSEKLGYLFRKYPCLPQQLHSIYTATQPPPEEDASMSQIPASLLKGLPAKKNAWNHDVGVQNGKNALRRARQAYGMEGEAIREYSELVLHILEEENLGGSANRSLQQAVAQQDASLIERLMEQEKR